MLELESNFFGNFTSLGMVIRYVVLFKVVMSIIWF